jgi:DNA-binding LytR/AlgR family response regulator
MKYFETHLDPERFIRVHRSSIVNADHIHRLELYDKESYMVILKNNVSVKASSSGYKLLKEKLHL